MFIDAHTHIIASNAEKQNFLNVSLSLLCSVMNKEEVDYAIVSNIDAIETRDTECGYEFINKENSQISLIKSLLEVTKNNDKLFILPWCKPNTEGFSKELGEIILKNRDKIKGLKFHPYHSKLKITGDKIVPYIYFAEKYNLPILVHCAIDEYSQAKYTYEMAKKYPKVKFIMAHLELMQDDFTTARRMLLELDNLYADTAWLPFEEVINIIKDGGEDKIIFGTDAPINGIDHYEKYRDYFDIKKITKISNIAYNKLMYKNAIYVYNLKGM